MPIWTTRYFNSLRFTQFYNALKQLNNQLFVSIVLFRNRSVAERRLRGSGRAASAYGRLDPDRRTRILALT